MTLDTLAQTYKDGKCDWKQSLDLVQGLLDTEKIDQYPDLRRLADYYVAEGLCYYVPNQ